MNRRSANTGDKTAGVIASAATLQFWVGMAGLALVTLCTFAPLFDAQFVSMDDPGTIAANPKLNFGSIGHFWTNFERGLYAPVTYTFWIGLASIKLSPALFHTADVLLHVITSLLVAGILKEVLKSTWPAVIGAMIFAVHPLQVEAVAWASGTKDLLAGLFGMLAVLMYLRNARSGMIGSYVAGTSALVLAMLSKPSAMTIPGVVLVLDWLILRRPARTIARAAAPWLAISIVCMAVAWLAQPATRAESAPLWARPLLVGDSLAFYLWKLIIPLRLAICYGRVPAEIVAGPSIYVAWLFPSLLLLLVWLQRRETPALLAAMLIFIIAPAPMLGLFKFDFQYYSSVADHYVYTAMLGPAIAVAWLVMSLRSRPVWIGAAIASIALAALSFRQASYWKDDATLLAHSLSVEPRGLLPLQNLGNYYAQRGEQQLAIPLFEQALSVRPSHYESMLSLATSLAKMNRTEEAIIWFRRFLRHVEQLERPDRPANYADFAFTFAHTLLNHGETEEAIHWLEVCVKERPRDAVAARDLEQARRRLTPATLP